MLPSASVGVTFRSSLPISVNQLRDDRVERGGARKADVELPDFSAPRALRLFDRKTRVVQDALCVGGEGLARLGRHDAVAWCGETAARRFRLRAHESAG